ncbi:MAG: GGDEF domain-containing protein [Aquamicrobium sp.]|uniref:GGDEF domain-containing protein n=1 Tax=Aquamicrobium sp. TaxID=1872579 RepID=UPI00349EE834|nr:GGDEF domain-containing protein [Aquamicrobium sp.]
MTFILIASAIAIAIMAIIFLCLRASRVAGLSSFAASAMLGSFAIGLGAAGKLVLPPNLIGLPESPLVILACLLLLSSFRQFLSMPALRPLTIAAVVAAFTVFHVAFALIQGGVTSVIGAGTASVIFAAIARTIWRGRGNADAPAAFVVFAIVSASTVSAFFLARFVTIASGIDGSSYFADPTAWNLAVSSIRILVFPLVYLSAILLVQGRTVARLERALAYDDLTGALSRRAFIDACSRHFAQGRDGGAGTLLFLDLDHFKQLNDRHGHAVGDKALRHFVEVASTVLPPRASLGRLGGEEFAVLLPASANAAAATVAETIMQAVRDNPLDTGRALAPMTVSIGSAAAHPGMAMDDVLKRADDALYRAKASGRDRLCHADEVHSVAGPRTGRAASAGRGRIKTPPPLVPAAVAGPAGRQPLPSSDARPTREKAGSFSSPPSQPVPSFGTEASSRRV